jgi:glucose-1-phosphate thymidylyltransferase
MSEERMREIAKPMLKNQYGQYLLKVIDEMKEDINSNTFTHPEMSNNKK